MALFFLRLEPCQSCQFYQCQFRHSWNPTMSLVFHLHLLCKARIYSQPVWTSLLFAAFSQAHILHLLPKLINHCHCNFMWLLRIRRNHFLSRCEDCLWVLFSACLILPRIQEARCKFFAQIFFWWLDQEPMANWSRPKPVLHYHHAQPLAFVPKIKFSLFLKLHSHHLTCFHT